MSFNGQQYNSWRSSKVSLFGLSSSRRKTAHVIVTYIAVAMKLTTNKGDSTDGKLSKYVRRKLQLLVSVVKSRASSDVLTYRALNVCDLLLVGYYDLTMLPAQARRGINASNPVVSR